MNIHTQVSHHVVTGIVSTFERLTNVWRTRASEQNSVPSSWPDRFDMTALLHDNAPRDASRVFPRKSGAPCQEPTRQNQPGLRAYRPSPAARFDRIRQLRTSLSGFITRSNRRAEEAIHDPATDGLKPVLDIVPAAAIVVDEAHTVVLANELAATLFGYTKEELGSLSFVQLFPAWQTTSKMVEDRLQRPQRVMALQVPVSDERPSQDARTVASAPLA